MIYKHQFSANFVILDNAFLKNPNISLKAKGLLAYILSQKDDWRVYVKQLNKVLKEGEDAIRTGFTELIEHEYVVFLKQKDSQGKFIEGDYHCFHTQADCREFKKSSPHRGFPDVDLPHVENRQLTSTKENKDQNTTTTREAEDPVVGELRSKLSSEDLAHALKYIEGCDLWKKADSAVAWLVRAGKERWSIPYSGATLALERKREAEEIVKRSAGFLLSGVEMMASEEALVIVSGMTRHIVSYKLKEEEWKEKVGYHLKRMNLR